MSTVDIIIDDATKLNSVSDNSIDLIIAAPPFINRDPEMYGGNPSSQINYNSKNMLKLLVKSTKQMERVLKDTGSIWIEVSPDDGLMYRYISSILSKTNLKHVDTIVHKIVRPRDLFKNNEYIVQDWLLWFHLVKDPSKYYFNNFKVKKYNESMWELELTNKKDLVDIELQKEYSNVFDYSVVQEIPRRFIEMYTKPNSTVLDPFGGSGTVAAEAYKLKRNAISIDVSPVQKEIAEKRLEIVKRIEHVQ